MATDTQADQLEPVVAAATRSVLPDADLSLATVIGRGFDVVAWRVPASDGDWTLRVPRLHEARATIAAQHCLGERLAAAGLPVPRDPMLLHHANGEVIAGLYRYAEGRHAEVAGNAERRRLARELAGLLSRLHALPTDVGIACGAKPFAPWREVYAPMIERCAPLLPARTGRWLRGIGTRLAAASIDLPTPRLVHADLKPEHVLIDSTGAITAVLDFEGARVTDPAVDFSRIIQNWNPGLATLVLADYRGRVDEAFMTRAECYRELDALELFDHSLIYDWPEWRARARRMLGARAARGTRMHALAP